MNPLLEPFLRVRQGPMTAELLQGFAAGPLGQVPRRLHPVSTAKAICGFCSTGCSLRVHLNQDGEAIGLTPDPDYPVNRGTACPKGWEALTPLAASDRATTPLLRNPRTNQLEPVSWPRALEVFVTRMQQARQRHGPDSLGVLSTGQIFTEEMALLGVLTKVGMGIRHLDSNTRQCMATSHVAYKQSFGFDAPPFAYSDLEESDTLLFFGANPAIAHPILWRRVQRNPRQPRIIVMDPRLTETATAATTHLRLYPKSDLWLVYGLSREILDQGWANRGFLDAHTSGYTAFADFLRDYPVERCAGECGIAAAVIRSLARTIHASNACSFWWTMGINQGHQSTRTAQAIINLALLTGHIGRPGTGPNSITGQCNAMGSRLFGNATSLLGGRAFENAQHREEVARLLGVAPSRIPAEPSWSYDRILDGIDAGQVRALWVIATNPAHSWINQRTFRERRDKLDFLVVQDMYSTTETAQLADLVLPAAGWGEKEGTFINSERRIGFSRKVARAPGEALSDFSIFRLIAEAWGCRDLLADWRTPADVFQQLKRLSAGRPCDFTGVRDYAHLERAGGIQWPFTSADDPAISPPERRLFSDGGFFTPDGRARFHFDPPVPLPEPPDHDYPLLLNTGRGSSAQWHTGTRTNKSAVLRKLAPTQLYVEIHPADASGLGVKDQSVVRVITRRGAVHAIAQVTATVTQGQLFLPMHFPGVNTLTFPAYDPHSRQPGYKACAARLEPALDGENLD